MSDSSYSFQSSRLTSLQYPTHVFSATIEDVLSIAVTSVYSKNLLISPVVSKTKSLSTTLASKCCECCECSEPEVVTVCPLITNFMIIYNGKCAISLK
jgi:hypothetical protein